MGQPDPDVVNQIAEALGLDVRELDPAAALVNSNGRAARSGASDRCPRCGAPASKRVASSGFGVPYPICSLCGYEFTDLVWVAP